MSSKEEKARRKKILDDLKAANVDKFKSGLPMPVENFRGLFDFLNDQLDDCDHSMGLTDSYLDSIGADKEKVKLWLNEMGGYCDCEVLYNVEEQFEKL